MAAQNPRVTRDRSGYRTSMALAIATLIAGCRRGRGTRTSVQFPRRTAEFRRFVDQEVVQLELAAQFVETQPTVNQALEGLAQSAHRRVSRPRLGHATSAFAIMDCCATAHTESHLPANRRTLLGRCSDAARTLRAVLATAARAFLGDERRCVRRTKVSDWFRDVNLRSRRAAQGAQAVIGNAVPIAGNLPSSYSWKCVPETGVACGLQGLRPWSGRRPITA